jgi:protein-S-isoprenylcysteine O-methyltransferase Ste14
MKDKLSKLSPLLFTIFGLIFLSIVTFRQFLLPRPIPVMILQILTILSYVGYMTFESKISFKELDKKDSDEHDRHTMELAAVIKILLLFSCLGLGNQFISNKYYVPVAGTGMALMFLGFITRGKSIVDLGEHYGHRIRPLGDHLHDRGIYSVIRHGAYAGTFFIHLGVTMVFLNIFSSILILAWLAVVVLRIKLEENLLLQDNRYKEYAQRTKHKMIPGIW